MAMSNATAAGIFVFGNLVFIATAVLLARAYLMRWARLHLSRQKDFTLDTRESAVELIRRLSPTPALRELRDRSLAR